jgi:hypothetical protein
LGLHQKEKLKPNHRFGWLDFAAAKALRNSGEKLIEGIIQVFSSHKISVLNAGLTGSMPRVLAKIAGGQDGFCWPFPGFRCFSVRAADLRKCCAKSLWKSEGHSVKFLYSSVR